MNNLRILMLLCVILGAAIARSAQKEKHFQKDPKKVVLFEEDLDALRAKNEDAENLFQQGLESGQGGNDPYPQIIKDAFHVTITPKSLLLEDSAFAGDVDVYLNSNALWTFTGNDKQTYRADNIQSIDLTEVVAETDKVHENTCCDNVRSVFRDENRSGIFCFQINTKESIWTLCSQAEQQQELVETFRQQVVLHVIRANGNKLNNAIIVTDPLYDNPDSWSWTNQAQWKHQCNNGQFQSPIQIDTSHVRENSDFQLTWAYNNLTNVEAEARYNGKEIEVHGDFGSISIALKDESGTAYDLRAHKITFKFDAEHSIKDEEGPRDFVGEMLVHHVSQSGVRAIASFMLVDDTNALKNEFFEQLQAFNWKVEPGFSEDLDYKPDLNQIVFGGAADFYDKSFYFYVGSETQPPCQEGVLRILFETPIGLLPSQLKPLMTQNFDN